MTTPQLYFFIGKGGVGKSTTSALTAVHLAAAGRRTLLVSMDPAHNQRDIFDTPFSEKPRPVAEGLSVKEIDTDYWIKRYLKQTRDQIQRTYTYQSAFNLQDHFKILQFSPGLEEYALLLAFENVVHGSNGHDAIVFDMAPTALSLRFFSLPTITLVWLDELMKLRKSICEKKEIISKIKFGKKEFETDRVKGRLKELIRTHTHLKAHFMSPDTRIHLVVNGDRLSRSEALRIHKHLAAIPIEIARIVVNKVAPEETGDDIARAFPEQSFSRLPLIPGGILGLPALQEVVASHPEAFSETG
ncbi:anion transporter [Desulfosarcina alkanivorans]|uniref:arsenite-transporting ATPase n=1 Tax=Desulfosarcina alkanivorans TaxID=571177 RepID=A0A5K7YX19_9BACT|nr:ArsA family ATPase [Desulfosarcina alkanivorans]BBO70834.1 anion transporter [Desulfosarcina alkanivorans]